MKIHRFPHGVPSGSFNRAEEFNVCKLILQL